MSIIDSLLRRQTALRLRKEYDHLRERADKLNPIEKRLEVLRLLDQAEPSIVSLEEHHMSSYEKKKAFAYIHPILRKAKFMIEETKKAAKEKNAEFDESNQNH